MTFQIHLMTSRRHFETSNLYVSETISQLWSFSSHSTTGVLKINNEIGQRSPYCRQLKSIEWMSLWLRMQKYELRMQLSNFNFSLPQVLHLMEFHYFRYLSFEWSVSKRLLIFHMIGPISGLYLVSLKPRHVNLSMRQTRILTYA